MQLIIRLYKEFCELYDVSHLINRQNILRWPTMHYFTFTEIPQITYCFGKQHLQGKSNAPTDTVTQGVSSAGATARARARSGVVSRNRQTYFHALLSAKRVLPVFGPLTLLTARPIIPVHDTNITAQGLEELGSVRWSGCCLYNSP